MYYYNKSRQVSSPAKKTDTSFNAEVPPTPVSEKNQLIDELTKPADPRGRLSYPANVYQVGERETLFNVGEKLSLGWQLLQRANGIINENLIQAGDLLVVPKLDPLTDYYRINFLIDQDRAAQLNRDLREIDAHELFSPLEVAKKSAVGYFGINDESEFKLLEADLANGTAVVEVSGEPKKLIGLIQPRVKGERGFWAILYVEER